MAKQSEEAFEEITEDELQEFKLLVSKHKGIKLTNEEAYDQASRLVRVVEGYIKFKQ